MIDDWQLMLTDSYVLMTDDGQLLITTNNWWLTTDDWWLMTNDWQLTEEDLIVWKFCFLKKIHEKRATTKQQQQLQDLETTSSSYATHRLKI